MFYKPKVAVCPNIRAVNTLHFGYKNQSLNVL
jgi:hypothetical protein